MGWLRQQDRTNGTDSAQVWRGKKPDTNWKQRENSKVNKIEKCRREKTHREWKWHRQHSYLVSRAIASQEKGPWINPEQGLFCYHQRGPVLVLGPCSYCFRASSNCTPVDNWLIFHFPPLCHCICTSMTTRTQSRTLKCGFLLGHLLLLVQL